MTIMNIKVLACICMFIDHAKLLFPNIDNLFFEFLGRIAFPLFAFALVEGYIHTKDLKKYMKRMFILALISEIPFLLFWSSYVGKFDFKFCTIFSLLIGLIMLYFIDHLKNKGLSIALSIVVMFYMTYFNFDYYFLAVLLIEIYYIFRNNKCKRTIWAIVATVFYRFILFGFNSENIIEIVKMAGRILPFFIINFYNGEKGKGNSKFFYYFYPIHLIFLYVLHLVLI